MGEQIDFARRLQRNPQVDQGNLVARDQWNPIKDKTIFAFSADPKNPKLPDPKRELIAINENGDIVRQWDLQTKKLIRPTP